MTKNFEGLLSKVNECETKKLAVAVAQDRPVLEAVKIAKERKIADAILVGDEDQIKAIGAEIGMNMDDYRIIDEKDVVEASLKAVKLVHDGEADMYMSWIKDRKASFTCMRIRDTWY